MVARFIVSIIVNGLLWVGLGYTANKYSQATVNEIADAVAKKLQSQPEQTATAPLQRATKKSEDKPNPDDTDDRVD